jgi:uncharacterized protein (TIRG00374 family)
VVSLLESWPELDTVRPVWFGVLLLLEFGSFASLWWMTRLLLPGLTWFVAGTSQLAAAAASKVMPGGSATAGVVQASMLVRSGQQGPRVAAALGSIGLLTTGMLLALPILTIPAVIIGPPPARQLQLGLVVSLVVAAVLVLLGLALLHWDGFVRRVGRVAGFVAHLVRPQVPASTVADAVVAQRDSVAAAFAGRWTEALVLAASNRMLDYAALVSALYAVGARARPSMVLLAYVLSLALALVPVTPGGVGFVEAGLTTVLVLAGVASDQAVLATLLYRLFSYWLPIPLGAAAWAGFRLHGPPFPRPA